MDARAALTSKNDLLCPSTSSPSSPHPPKPVKKISQGQILKCLDTSRRSFVSEGKRAGALRRTHCYTLQHTATHSTLQHATAHCNTLYLAPYTATHCNKLYLAL